MIVYTAARSLAPSHVAGTQYLLNIEGVDAIRNRTVDKTVLRSKGGAIETLRNRADNEWTLTFAPVNGLDVAKLIEFLDSTEGGEKFQLFIYGTESAAKSLRRTDSGYQLSAFMRVGSEAGDYFQASAITAVEVP